MMPGQKEQETAPNSLNHYLNKIGKYPLLTREEEQQLGKILTGESNIERMVSSATLPFAEDYLAQITAHAACKQQIRKCYEQYREDGKQAEKQRTEQLRKIYEQDHWLLRGFIAVAAHYLINAEKKRERAPKEPIWKPVWDAHENLRGHLDNEYEKNRENKRSNTTKGIPQVVCAVPSFTPALYQYTQKHPTFQDALYHAYLQTNRDCFDACEVFMTRNLRLVVREAKKYFGKGLPLDDLIQFGNIGLMAGAKRFDYQLGYKFSTYEGYWVRQAIFRGLLTDANTIRIPLCLQDRINKIRQLRQNLIKNKYREPTEAEVLPTIQEAFGINKEKAREYLMLLHREETLSLEANDENQDASSFLEAYQVPSQSDEAFHAVLPNPDEKMYMQELQEQTEVLLAELSPQEEFILRRRFGIGAVRAHALEEIGNILDLTRERVRQIELKAVKKLRKKNGPVLRTLL